MRLTYLFILVCIPLLIWIIFNGLLSAMYLAEDKSAFELVALIVGNFVYCNRNFPSCFYLLPFTFYLIHRVVPKIAAQVDPLIHDLMMNNSETGFFKFHWLTTYSLCIISKRMYRRIVRRGSIAEYDFRLLDRELRIPVMVWFYWLMLVILSLVIGGGLLKLGEHLGYYDFTDF